MSLRNKNLSTLTNPTYFFRCTGCSQKRNEAIRNSGTGVSPVRSDDELRFVNKKWIGSHEQDARATPKEKKAGSEAGLSRSYGNR
jgi:hypothetical protein